MQFLISLDINPAVLDALTDKEKAAIGEGHGRFIHALKQSRELITTQTLVDPSQTAVVTVCNGQPVVTDGRFLETKEHLAASTAWPAPVQLANVPGGTATALAPYPLGRCARAQPRA